MRDPKRIQKVMAEISATWEQHPDLRLGQLIRNAISPDQLFYVEDQQLADLIRKLSYTGSEHDV